MCLSRWLKLLSLGTLNSAQIRSNSVPSGAILDMVVIGTYFVEKSDQDAFSPSQRRGRIYLKQLTPTGTLKSVQRLDTDAVLDMKWAPNLDVPLLAVADAKGWVSIYQLNDDETGLEFKDKQSIKDGESVEDLSLSLDWNCRKSRPRSLQIVVSGSRGHLTLFTVNLGETKFHFEKRKHVCETSRFRSLDRGF